MATITGTAGNDTLVGTAEDDFLLLGPGSDSVDGGAGRDVLQLAPGAVETLGLGPGPHVYNVEPGRITDASGTINTVFTNVETVLLADQSGADVIVNHQPTGVTVQVQVSRGNFTINGSAAGGGEIVIVDVVGGAPLIASASDRNTLKLTQSGRTDVTARQIESVLIESSDSSSGVLFDSTIISSVRPRFFFVGTDRTDIINGGAESATILVRGSADDADRLRGGGGSTIYTIRSLTQVGMNGQILDFSVSDQINLADNFSTGVLPQFIGTSDFSGVAGQVRYAFVDATTVLLADTDGDRVADQRLTLANGRFYLDQFATNQLRTFFTPALIGTDGADSLVGTDSADILLGLGDNDTLRGGAGNDTLDGGSGVDHMFDSEGVNTFLVDNPADLVSGGGYAIVIASVNYTIRSLVAELRAAPGTAPINLTGTQDFQLVVGNDGDNILNGLSVGTLPGQALSTGDTLIGLGGNDTFAVQNSFTIVTEATGGGIDTIFASVDYTLQAGSEIEVLSAANQTGTEPLRFTGNEFAQTIVGNFGANALRGGGGADTLIGLRGDDSYTVDTTGTVIREAAGEGFDTLVVTAGAANFLLNGGASVEMLRAEAGSAPINIGGNEFSQRIEGNDGANILSSGGGGGVDTMVGGLGDDVYRVFATGDVIEDMGGFDTVFASGTSYFLYSTAEVEYLSPASRPAPRPSTWSAMARAR
jgi:Ca2+-binding RTX toxin-like protein